MKILRLAPDVDLVNPSGGSSHEIGISRALAKLGHKIVLIGYGKKTLVRREKNFEVRTYPWIRNSMSGRDSREKVDKISKIIDEIRPDVLYYRVEPFEAFGFYYEPSLPMIIEINYNFYSKHSSGLWTHLWPVRNFLLTRWLKKTVSKAKAVVCVSDSVRKRLNAHGVGGMKTVVHNGVDLGDFKKSKKEMNRIIFVGGAGKHQGADILVDASKILDERGIEHKVVIVGGFDSFIEEVKKKKADNVMFTGILPRKKAVELMQKSDIGVAPFRDDKEPYGFSPIKIFEYMASGMAIVASDTEWNKEVVDGKNGLVFTVGDAKAFADQLEILISNPRKKKIFQKRAFQDAKAYYNWSRAASQIVDLCELAVLKKG